MPDDRRKKHHIHVVTIISTDPESYLPEGMKKYYGSKGITFGDFPMQPIGRAKDLMDEMPDSKEFFKNMPEQPEEDKGYPIGSLLGEYYTRHGKKAVKLGNIKELVAMAKAEGPAGPPLAAVSCQQSAFRFKTQSHARSLRSLETQRNMFLTNREVPIR